MSRPMKCNICESGDMEHVQIKHTHIYVCEECPNVQLEYHDSTDATNLCEYLHGQVKKMTPIEKVKYAIAEYISLPYKHATDKRLADGIYLLLGNQEEITMNVAEQYELSEELVDAVIQELLKQR